MRIGLRRMSCNVPSAIRVIAKIPAHMLLIFTEGNNDPPGLNKSAMPSAAMLKELVPNMLAIAMSGAPILRAVSVVVNSGNVVTSAKASTPIKLVPTPVSSAILSALIARIGPDMNIDMVHRRNTVHAHVRE